MAKRYTKIFSKEPLNPVPVNLQRVKRLSVAYDKKPPLSLHSKVNSNIENDSRRTRSVCIKEENQKEILDAILGLKRSKSRRQSQKMILKSDQKASGIRWSLELYGTTSR